MLEYISASRDYPDFGIKKGDRHYFWIIGNKQHRSIARPRQSAVQTNRYRRQFYLELESVLFSDQPPTRVVEIRNRLLDLKSEYQIQVENLDDRRRNDRAKDMGLWVLTLDDTIDLLSKAVADSTISEREQIVGQLWDIYQKDYP